MKTFLVVVVLVLGLLSVASPAFADCEQVYVDGRWHTVCGQSQKQQPQQQSPGVGWDAWGNVDWSSAATKAILEDSRRRERERQEREWFDRCVEWAKENAAAALDCMRLQKGR